MAKLHINDLHYLVMEGGGARGNTYLGAIRALEEQLKKRQEENQAAVFIADADLSGRSGIPGLLDYLELNDEGEKVPVIQGVAGASAGAITTFALTLGLNSAEIDEVLKFDFTRFLSETDVAKYRMIGEDSDLMIGEDSGLKIEEDPNQIIERSRVKTIGGRRSKPFEYDLKKDKTKVNGNFIKAQKRSYAINFVLSSVFKGLVTKIGEILPFIQKLSEKYEEPSWIAQKIEKLANFMGKNAAAVGNFVQKYVYDTVLKFFIYRAINWKSPIKIDINAIGGVIWDRGMFSGFQVREFFYDLMLYAATRDTHFQRSLIANYSDKAISTGTYEFTTKNLSYPKFKIGKRSETEFGPEATALFNHLQNLTFREFFEITQIDFGAAVSNFTADSTVYFSERWTPQFRVLEAVGASMTIPPAIRPVYNASDVFFETPFETAQTTFPRKDFGSQLSIVINGEPKPFVNAKGQFMKTDYALYEQVVKKALQLHLLESSADGVYVDLNNDIELHTFLPVLRGIVIGDLVENSEGVRIRENISLKHHEISFNGNTYQISQELLTFFYNAQFKGLLLDGGYRNNIPYNYFRDRLPNLDGVLAIKLDSHFPPEFMEAINKEIEQFLRFESQVAKDLDTELEGYLTNPNRTAIEKKLTQVADGKVFDAYDELVAFVQTKFNAYFNQQEAIIKNHPAFSNNPSRARRKVVKADRNTILKLLEHWLDQYGKQNFIKPWAVSKSILATAMEGYDFGTERGQVRFITDHDHILPLYDYGVGTYDFDLEKVRPLAAMSREKAEDAVNLFFE